MHLKQDPVVAQAVAAELLPFREREDWDGALQVSAITANHNHFLADISLLIDEGVTCACHVFLHPTICGSAVNRSSSCCCRDC